jgi:NADH dehydrogenase (ubiquinone) 1 beta subcomplex subunit 10
VPTIDQCYTDDYVCIYEADAQFKRDKMVDNEILAILRSRFEDCVLYEAPDHMTKCIDLKEAYEKAAGNWFSKCELIDIPQLQYT